MVLKIAAQFANDFKIIKDDSLTEKVKRVLEMLKTAASIDAIPQFKKINGNMNAYKMGIGFYYLVGVMTSTNEITLMRFLHRDQVLETMNREI